MEPRERSTPPAGATTRSKPRKRRRRLPFWVVPAVIIAVLAASEVGARVVGPNIPRTSGSEERAFIKADQMYDRAGPTDVAILGSSETAGGLIPARIQEEAPGLDGFYNAALAGTFLPTYRDWADDVVIPALDPEVVVIGMLPMTVSDIDAMDSDDYTKPREAYLSAIDQITGGRFGSAGWELRQRSALIRYRPYLRQPPLLWEGIVNTLQGGIDATAPEGGGGMDWKKETDPAVVLANTGDDGEVADYREPSIPTEADPIGAALYTRFSQARLDLDGIEAFSADLRDQGITPVVVLLPVDRGPLEAGGADLATLDSWSEAVAEWGAANDVPVLTEFTEDWDPTLFHDRNHLDAQGAEALSTQVGAWLQDLCTAGDLHEGCGDGG